MRIVLTGGTGLIGQTLGQKLTAKNHKIHLLARKPVENAPYPCKIFLWPEAQSPPPSEAFPSNENYGVIHLAGEPVSKWPWTPHLKNKIYSSRVKGAKNLVASIQKLSQPPSRPPAFFLSAGAIGIYGEQTNQKVTEGHLIDNQNLFLQKVCQDWEKEALKAHRLCRTVVFRIGIVLSSEKGFLHEQIKWMKRGIRPLILSSQPCYMSWIALEDLVRMILWAVENPQVEGIYNAVSPKALPLKEFYKILSGYIKGKSLPLPCPLFLMRLMGGEMTKNLLISCKAFPEKALKQGFAFKKAELKEALKS